MDIDFLTLLNWLGDRDWVGPLMGVAVAALAFVVGRRFFADRPGQARLGPQSAASTSLQGVNSDRRGAPRRRGATVEVCLDDGSGADPVPGWVTDRSVGGLGLLVDDPVTIGAV